MRYVRETKAGRSISVHVILNKRGQEVAIVQAHYSDAGAVLVNVFTEGDSALEKTAKALGLDNVLDAINQSGRDTGYPGSLVDALAGLVIDGHTMQPHCGQTARTKRFLKQYHAALNAARGPMVREADKYWQEKARKAAIQLANYKSDLGGFSSAYEYAGLDQLTRRGYRVITAI